MPFLCCIRKQLKECDADVKIIENKNGFESNANSESNNKYETSKENEVGSMQQQENATNLNNNLILQTAASSVRCREDGKNDSKCESNYESEPIVSNCEENLIQDADLQIYEQYVSRLENIASMIEQQFSENFVSESEQRNEFCGDDCSATTLETLKYDENMKIWLANNINNNSSMSIEIQKGQHLKLSNCNNSVFKINGSAGRINIADCSKCSFIIEEANEIFIYDCKKLEVQTLKCMNVMHASNVDGLMLILSQCHINKAQFYVKKCSEVNFCCPSDGDQVELALPEQMRTTWNGQAWVSEAFAHK